MSSPDTVALSIRLPRELHTRLTALAKAEYSSVNREATIAIRTHLSLTENANHKRGNLED